MRRSLLSFGHLVSVALAWLTKPVLTVGIGPLVAYGTLTPGVGDPPKVNQPRRYRRRQDAPVASLFLGMIRHHASAQFARFFDTRLKRRASGWMVVA